MKNKEKKQAVVQKCRYLVCMVMLIFCMGVTVAPTLEVSAQSSSATDANWITAKGDGTSNKAINNVTTKVKKVSRSVYRLIGVVFAAVAIGSLMIAGICIAAKKNPNSREENKTWILYICVAIAIVSGAVSIYGFVSSIC